MSPKICLVSVHGIAQAQPRTKFQRKSLTVNPRFDPRGLINFMAPNQPTLWGDKVSMLTHIYPHKPQRKIEVTICKITRLTAHFMCGLM